VATAAGNSGDGELAGRVALVTGAAGGIGSAVTARLLAAGASVVAEDLDPLPAPDGYADRFAVVQGDAAQAATARAAVHAATAGFGRLDILVNLAGRFLGQSILDTSDEAWDALMATNVRSVFVHCREAVPALLAGGGGAIVTAGSISGQVGLAQQAAYGTTKAAVTLLTRQLAVEYASSGLRANVVAPGARRHRLRRPFPGGRGRGAGHAGSRGGQAAEDHGHPPDRPDGHAAGDRRGDRVPGLAASELHHRCRHQR
jgi:NAD(P)-dependent dehydrogenase (short-subunit alcohol dehydrogenase family)